MDSVWWRSRTFAHADGAVGSGESVGEDVLLVIVNGDDNDDRDDDDDVHDVHDQGDGVIAVVATAEMSGNRDRPRELRQAARERIMQMAEDGIGTAVRLKAMGLHIADRVEEQLQGIKFRLEEDKQYKLELEQSRDATAMFAPVSTEEEEKKSVQPEQAKEGDGKPRLLSHAVLDTHGLKFFRRGMERRSKAMGANELSAVVNNSAIHILPAKSRRARAAARQKALASREVIAWEKSSVRVCRIAMKAADEESRLANQAYLFHCARRAAFDRASAELLRRMRETGFLPNQRYGRVKLFAMQGLRKKAGRLQTFSEY